MTTSVKHFTGSGTVGNWNDPANWGGQAPGASDTAIVSTSALETGAFTTGRLMLLGQEQVTFDGAITTLSTAPCTSLMVCDNAVATFAPGSSVHVAGGFVTGNEGVGTLHLNDATVDVAGTFKLGNTAVASGTATMVGGSLTVQQNLVVGGFGKGSFTVTGGSISVGAALMVAHGAGSSGSMSLIGGHVTAQRVLVGPENHGPGTLSVSGGGLLEGQAKIAIGSGSALVLANGTAEAGSSGAGIDVFAGATLSGHGALVAPVVTVDAGGLIDAQGGTLSIAANVAGSGEIKIEAGSTVALTGEKLGSVQIAFAGSNAALDLAHGISSGATLTGFAAGDSLVMPGVDALSWNAAHDVLTLSEGGTVVDRLHLTGSWGQADPFVLTESSAGAVITLAPHL